MRYKNEAFDPLWAVLNEAEGTYRIVFKAEICGEACVIAENESTLITVQGDAVNKYCKFAESVTNSSHGFLGFTAEKLMESGRDLVGEALLEKGFDFDDVKGILPAEFTNGYVVIGSYTSRNSYTVDRMGCIYRQPEYSVKSPGALGFSPESISPLGKEKPRISFIDGIIPILICRFEQGCRALETTYLAAQGNYFVEFPIWIRAVEYSDGEIVSTKFYNADIGNPSALSELDSRLYYDYFLSVLDHSNSFIKEQTYLRIPEKQLERSFYATMLTADGQTDGFRLKYGNLIYNLETHDNFPPNYITSISTYAMCGHLKKARLMAEHFLTNAVDARGMLVYRQGKTQDYGYSGSEIGQLLWVLERIGGITTPKGWLDEYADVLKKIGDNLALTVSAVEGHEDISLVHMCAEADTNGRVYDYLQNSLWAIRGFEALSRMTDSEKYMKYAELLRASVKKAAETFKEDTPYGELIPFQLQYPALPLTLSKCRDTSFEVTEEYLENYFRHDADPHDDFDGRVRQDFWENSYANYRYYPEILSSMLIDKKYADTIDTLRRSIGGELLGMTRFLNRLDDWPAYNNAIYLLETGQTDRYRLLMYSHLLYHGMSDYGVYYEQVGFNEESRRVFADTSLPCNMLPAFMILQMLCYTSVDGKTVEILKAIPKKWFDDGFEIRRAYTPYGAVSVEVRDKTVALELDGDFSDVCVKLFLPDRTVEVKERKTNYLL